MDSWHLMVYTTSTAYGLLVLVNVSLSGFVDKLSEELDLQEPYFLNLSQCYSGYPSKAPPQPVMGYWCLQVSLYMSELVSCLVGTMPRKKERFVCLMF
ncbi:hypothetical protein GBAR_LOCUS961 [Geodia barretti]|uniref:Uncharacterized protein n=1 Tax=Geodia barretti TaxID=519541 RepID=A0AA35QVI1_GEOBA|nr:hypothetical protein GBAR_LOCUS961 [Geodia barretti]